MNPDTVWRILLVEDNPGDVALFEEAVEVCGLPVRVHTVDHGLEALQFLRRQGPFADAPGPDVVVLDLNLPIMNGQELLAEMMADPQLQRLPVAVLTTSAFDQYVCDLCPPGRCLYFSKTDDFQLLQDIVRQIVDHAATAAR
ncbi:MAG: response regulator [Desulfobulbaceae bacterium]|nr:response regulator [Desulfobulbaceae bacterium]